MIKQLGKGVAALGKGVGKAAGFGAKKALGMDTREKRPTLKQIGQKELKTRMR